MCNKERLVAYLYGDLGAIERAEFESHLAGCAECRDEVEDLRQTRRHLAAWAPPEPEFNFQIVRNTLPAPAAPAAPARRFGVVPQWALAAAAALVLLAGAAAIANLEVRYTRDGSYVVRTGWTSGADAVPAGGTAAGQAPAGPQTAPVGASSEETEQLKAAVALLAQRVRQLEQAPPAVRNASAVQGVSPAELREILAESEARQRTELAVQVAQVLQDVHASRVRDFARVQDFVARAQGFTNTQLQQHRNSIESLSYRMASTQQK